MLKKTQNQKGSAHIIIAIFIVIVIIAALGYVLWNNLSHKSSNNSAQNSPQSSNTDSSDYLIVGDWNIKFTIPNELKSTKINFYQRQSTDQEPQTYYAFTTARIQALGGACKSQPFGDTQILYRYTVKPTATPDGELLNDAPLGGYYYVLTAPSAYCTVVDSNGALIKNATVSSTEMTDREALKSTLKTMQNNRPVVSYNPAIEVTSSADLKQMTDAPQSFQSFIINAINKDNANIRAQNSSCYRVLSVNQIYDQTYAVGGFNTAGGNDCVGGAEVLWGLENGSWMQISSTQNIGFECSQLDKYKVPTAIAGTICFDPASKDGSRAYSQS